MPSATTSRTISFGAKPGAAKPAFVPAKPIAPATPALPAMPANPGAPVAPTAAPTYQPASVPGAPSAQFDLTRLTPALRGNLRSAADIQANAQIANISRASGGNTGSPAFQLLSTIAKTGAAAGAGAAGAKLDLEAADVMRADEFARQQANAQAAQTANALALQTTLGLGNLDINRQQVSNQQAQFGSQLAENQRQFGSQFEENQRQFDTSAGEEQRQHDNSALENQRQFDLSLANQQTQFQANNNLQTAQLLSGLNTSSPNTSLVSAPGGDAAFQLLTGKPSPGAQTRRPFSWA